MLKYCSLFAVVLIGCTDASNLKVSDLLMPHRDSIMLNTFETKDTAFLTENGTFIYLDFNSTSYEGDVCVVIKEGYSRFSQIAHGLHTVSNDGVLETKGMVNIEVLDSVEQPLTISGFFRFSDMSDDSFTIYSLNNTGVWDESKIDANDLVMQVFPILRTRIKVGDKEYRNIYSHRIVTNDTIYNLEDYILGAISPIKIQDYFTYSEIKSQYLIEFIRSDGSSEYKYNRVVMNTFAEDGQTVLELESSIDLSTYFGPDDYILAASHENGDLVLLNTSGLDTVYQIFYFSFSASVLTNISHVDSIFCGLNPKNRITFLDNIFIPFKSGGWHNLDKLVFPNSELVAEIELKNTFAEDIAYASFENVNTLIKIPTGQSRNSIPDKFPLNESFNIIIIGLRNGELSYSIIKGVELLDSKTEIECKDMEPIKLEDLENLINSL